MTRIEELESKIAACQTELEQLKKKKEKHTKSMLPVNGNCFIAAEWDVQCYDGIGECSLVASKTDQNVFPTEEVAEAYKEAFSVMLELRRQPGSGVFSGQDPYEGWVVLRNGRISQAIGSVNFVLCPPFPTRELVEQAAKVVGYTRIAKVYETLIGVLR